MDKMLCSFLLLLIAIFAFGVSEEYPCQSEFIPPFKLRTRRLNVLEVHCITTSMKIHRWTDKKKFYYLALVNYNWFNFYLFSVSLNKKIKAEAFIDRRQPRPQSLLALQYGGGRREDAGTQQKSRD